MAVGNRAPQWVVDSFVFREGNLFSYGWCAVDGSTLAKLDLQLEYDDGTLETVPTRYGVNRPDVSAKYRGLPSECGYLAYAAVKHRAKVKRVFLCLGHADGSTQTLQYLHSDELEGGERKSAWRSRSHWGLLIGYAARALRLLFSGQWRTLWRRVHNLVAGLRSRAGTDTNLQSEFSRLRANAVFILDHSLGGGANKYRSELVQDLVQSGRDVVVWTFTPFLLRHEVRIHQGNDAPVSAFHLAWERWELLLASGKIGEVVFNNCVGFPRQEDVPVMLSAFKLTGGARLRILLHDFHMACPSHFLIDHQGKFCGVPDIAQCRACLPRIDDGLARLFAAGDIDLWRRRWGALLTLADEVVHFSPSSRTILSRAYPGIRSDQWVYRPHRMSAPVGRFEYPRDQAGLRVAVVGQIGKHKGSDVLLALASEASRQGVDLQLVVVGTMETSVHSDRISQTGVYRPEDLAKLLNQNRVHLALMPSIWAETFSYVTHELIDLMVPVLAFDFGAQAEAVSAYSRGRVIPYGTSTELLRALTDFKSELDCRDLS